MTSVGMQFRHEIVDVAAVPGAGEFDDAAVVEEAAPLDAKTGAVGGHVQQAGVLSVEQHGA